jgi:hypothetical protein
MRGRVRLAHGKRLPPPEGKLAYRKNGVELAVAQGESARSRGVSREEKDESLLRKYILTVEVQCRNVVAVHRQTNYSTIGNQAC